MKILATSWHGGGAEAIAPVITELLQRKHKVIVIAHGDTSINVFKKNNISYRKIANYKLKDISLESMTTLLQVEQPCLVLTGTVDRARNLEDDVIDQTMTLAAKQLKIKTLAILDSPRGFSDRFNHLGEKTFKFLPDKIVAEKNVIDTVKDQGFDSKALKSLGNPSFDVLSVVAGNFTKERKQAIRIQIGFHDVDHLIFYAGGTFQDQLEILGYWDYTVIQIISDVVKKVPGNVGMVIKLHPGTPKPDLNLVHGIISRSEKVKLITDIDLYDLILASDSVCTTYSTVGIKAIHMGKICLSLQPGLKTEDLFIPSRLGFIPVGYTKQACWLYLGATIFGGETFEKRCIEQAKGLKTDGKSTERIIELIYKMIGQ